MNHPADYRGQRVVVLGLARSGVSVAKLFHKLGANVVVNDRKDRESSPEAEELEALGITVICGYHPEDLIDEHTALLVKNPGIPYTASPVVQAIERGIDVVTEVEAACLISPAPIIGITGSNGKTTTTTLIGKLLEAAGKSPIVAGNIGVPLCEAAQEASADDWIVAELSSFQLKGTQTFRPRIALLLNLAETHLDYHGDMVDYVVSKRLIFANQTEEDTAVLNWDDPISRATAQGLKAKLLPFSLYERLSHGVCIEPPYQRNVEVEADVSISRSIVVRLEAGEGAEAATETIVMPVSEIAIRGRHNTANAMAAIAACVAAGAAPETLAAPLRTFNGVEHRLEFVCDKNGVKFYNSSKDTNSTATTMAARSLSAPLIIVAGGLDRGSDYMELLPLFKELKGLVVFGETRTKLAHVASLAGLERVQTVNAEKDAESTLHKAVALAYAMAAPGDTVLLSPACASWDMFESYEQRGSMFKQSAHTL
ncbi:UDP-N-acetylmuramoyl-L-alanine--D-glutamate ligase [Paenibacillus sp. strain BS8-2]